MYRKLFLLISAIAFLAPAARAQSADEIIAKNIQAKGGLEKLRAVNSRIETVKFSSGSFKADVREINKRPSEVRNEFILQGMTQIQAYDGKVGWRLSPFGGRLDPELLSQDDMKELVVDADMDGPLVDYQEKGHKAEYMGHDSVEGTDCYKVKLTLKNGNIRTYYFDTDSYLEIKLETQNFVRGAPRESETYFGDYDKVGGIYYPFLIEQGRKGDADRAQFTIEKVELNPPVEDSLFKVPETKSK